MKLCASSRSFGHQLADGRLTQLEWLDVCSGQTALDGVDLSVEHFPRRDGEYLAQIKKLCVDRCLSVAGVNTGVAFGAGEIDPQVDELKQAIDTASAVGAPLVRFSCGAALGSPGVAWRELVRGLKSASAHAKQRNVTLALEPRDGTLVAGDADVKRAFKECDSAWLRLAAPATIKWEPFVRDSVIMVMAPSHGDFGAAQRFRGFVSLEDSSGGADATALERWIQTLLIS